MNEIIQGKCIDCGDITLVTQTSPKDGDLKYGVCETCALPKEQKCGCVYMVGEGFLSKCYIHESFEGDDC